MNISHGFEVNRAANGGFVVHCGRDERRNIAAFTSAGDLLGWLSDQLRPAPVEQPGVSVDHVKEAYKAVTNDVPSAPRWIKWNGGDCPVFQSARVEVKYPDGKGDKGYAHTYRWNHTGSIADIVEYRVIPHSDLDHPAHGY